MPPKRIKRRRSEEFKEVEMAMESELPSGLPLPVVNANVFQDNIIHHIDASNNRMLEAALKASLESEGLEEAKEESQQIAGNELYQQVIEQLPYLKSAARQTLHLITGIDDIISNEKNQPHPVNLDELQRIQQSLQKALDTGESPPQEDTEAAQSFIAGYDVSTIKGAVFPRIELEIQRLEIEETEREAKELQETEDEQLRQALEASMLEEHTEETKIPEPVKLTPAELRAARVAAFERRQKSTVEL